MSMEMLLIICKNIFKDMYIASGFFFLLFCLVALGGFWGFFFFFWRGGEDVREKHLHVYTC